MKKLLELHSKESEKQIVDIEDLIEDYLAHEEERQNRWK
jgi:hypothetical protein